ncbi:MAG: amino acid racemase [Bacteroidales bacterium]|nr:amino acid racemase [Bacteroidales bacterium]
MKIPGLIGGVTWTSTIDYYRLINRLSNNQLGNHDTLEVLLYSVNFEKVLQMMTHHQWSEIELLFTEKAKALKNAGADFFVICSNTLSKVGQQVAAESNLPILDMVESVANAIHEKEFEKVAFLGTSFAMNDSHYRNGLKLFGIDAYTPESDEKEIINRIIMEELAYDILKPESRKTILKIMNNMQQKYDIEGVILGCTELPMLIKQADTAIPVFDTTEIHAKAIVEFALKS